METPYLDGVKGADGNTAIRALNQEEKDWLEKFYKQHYHADTATTPEAMELKKEITKEQLAVKNLRIKLKRLKKKKAEGIDEIKMEIADRVLKVRKLKRQVSNIYKEQGNIITDYDEVRKTRNENYTRNNCTFNIAKTHNYLDSFNESFNEDEELEEET